MVSQESTASVGGLEEDREDAERLEAHAIELEGVAEAIHASEEVQDEVHHGTRRLWKWERGGGGGHRN